MLYRILLMCALIWCFGCQTDASPELVKRTQGIKVVNRGQLIESPFGKVIFRTTLTPHHLLSHENIRVLDRSALRVYIASPQPGGLPWQKAPDFVDIVYKTDAGRVLDLASSKDRVAVIFQHDQQDTTNDVNIYVRRDDPLNPWKLEAHFEIPHTPEYVAFYDQYLYVSRREPSPSSDYYDVYRREGDVWQLDTSIERPRGAHERKWTLGDGFYARVGRNIIENKTWITVMMRKATGWEERVIPVDDRRFGEAGLGVDGHRLVMVGYAGILYYELDDQSNWRVESMLEEMRDSNQARWFVRDGRTLAILDEARHVAFYQMDARGVWSKTHEMQDVLPHFSSSRESRFFKLHEGALYVFQPWFDNAELFKLQPNMQGAFDVTPLNLQDLAWLSTGSFAQSIALSEDTLFIGDSAAVNTKGMVTGVVHIYQKTVDQGLTRWVWKQALEPPGEDDEFGHGVTYHNGKLLVRSQKDWRCNYYLYELKENTWSLTGQWMSTLEVRFEALSALSDYHIILRSNTAYKLMVLSRHSLDEPWPAEPYELNMAQLRLECTQCDMAINGHEMTLRVREPNVRNSSQIAVLRYDPNGEGQSSRWKTAFRLNESQFSRAQHLDDQHFIGLGARGGQKFIYIYDINAEEPWSLLQTLTFTSLDVPSYNFSVDGDIMVVWAHEANSIDQQAAGQAIVFERTLDPLEPWQRRYVLTPNQPIENARFSYPSATNGCDIAAVMSGNRRSGSRKVSVSSALFIKGASVAIQGAMNETLMVDLPITSDSTEDITCAVVSKPSHGVLEQVEGLRWRFVPETYYAGEDSALYTCQQGDHVTGPWRLDVEIEDNLMPVAKPDTFIIETNTLKGTLIGTDPEGESVTFRLVGEGPSNGTVTINAQSGAFAYTQTTTVAQDTFTYEVFDGVRPSMPATITINRPATPQSTPMANDTQCAKIPARPTSPGGLLVLLILGLMARFRKQLSNRRLVCLGLMFLVGCQTANEKPQAATTGYTCASGHAQTCAKQGFKYLDGDGVSVDYQRAQKYLKRGCMLKADDACSNLGWMYRFGRGVHVDHKIAADYFKKGCVLGSQYSCHHFARMEIEGTATKTNQVGGFKSLNRLCNEKYAKSCYRLGVFHQNGQHTKQSYPKAFDYFVKGCKLEHGASCNSLGWLVQGGFAVDADVKQAAALYKRGCARKNQTACYNVAILMIRGNGVAKDVSGGLNRIKVLCDAGHAKSCQYLGDVYSEGNLVKKDVRQSLMFHQKACELDAPDGCLSAGWMWRHALGDTYDAKRAVAFYQKACRLKSNMGCNNLAWSIVKGDGIKQDIKQGVESLKALCKQKLARSCSNLGRLYFDGEDLTRDYKKSLAFYKQGCTYRLGFSCYIVSHFYSWGLGESEDLKKSHKYAKAACSLGYDHGCNAQYAHLVWGRGVKANPKAAVKPLEQLCEKGVIFSCYNWLRALKEAGQKQWSASIAKLNERCKTHINACYSLSWVHRVVTFKQFNIPKAKQLVETGCKKGHMRSCMALGSLYHSGQIQPKNYLKSFELNDRACRKGYNMACVVQARFYVRGWGVPKNDKKALSILKPFCTDDVRFGCKLLGLIHEDYAAQRDLKKAYKAYKLGCLRYSKGYSCFRKAKLEHMGVAGKKDKVITTMKVLCDDETADACQWLGDHYKAKMEEAKPFYQKAYKLNREGCDEKFESYCKDLAKIPKEALNPGQKITP